VSKLPRRLARPFVHRTIVAVSRDRVIGADLKHARAAAGSLRDRGYEVTLAYWNQLDESATSVVSTYGEALHVVGDLGGQAYLSIKAPAFGFDAGLYEGLLANARALAIPLHFDSLGPEAADRTFSLIADHAAPAFEAVGCTLPGRWKRSRDDADRLAALGVTIRVVKGEWPDPDAPALDPEEGFLDIVTRLAGRAASVRIATHDGDLAERSIRILHRAGTPCDVELLYGFPVRGLLPRLKDLVVPVRVYVPFGYGWVPYCMDHVRTRPAFLWWLVRDSLAGRYADGFLDLGPGAGK
jgi:proline dehydrogenase